MKSSWPLALSVSVLAVFVIMASDVFVGDRTDRFEISQINADSRGHVQYASTQFNPSDLMDTNKPTLQVNSTPSPTKKTVDWKRIDEITKKAQDEALHLKGKYARLKDASEAVRLDIEKCEEVEKAILNNDGTGITVAFKNLDTPIHIILYGIGFN